MSYQALYRTWRPQTFGDVVGQEHVTKTLQNALLQGKVPHAYLFSGPRGTGKTTIAKVFAKTINCENGPTVEPCNQCETCKSIMLGTNDQVLEMDAASNNGVDDIRYLIEKVRTPPASVRYKVYIIDEVHMLSMGAFNALLKTLEEPPKHVIFILATTEPHKIPPTIISRCQRFEFRKISVQDIVDRLATVVRNEGTEVEEEALHIVARAAEGGMRDALSLIDQAISYSEDIVKTEDVLAVTGSVAQKQLSRLAMCIFENDVPQALRIIDELMNHGKDAMRFMEDFIYYYRDMLLYQTSPHLEDLLERVIVDEDFRMLSEQISAETIYEVIHTLSKSQQEMKWTNHPRIFLEVVMVKLCQQFLIKKQGSDHLQTILQRMQEMETELRHLKQHGVTISQEALPTVEKKAPKQNRTKRNVPSGRIHEVLKKATRKDLERVKGIWGEVLEQLKQQSKVAFAVLLENSEPVAASSDYYVLAFEHSVHADLVNNNIQGIQAMEQILFNLSGKSLQMVPVPKENWQDIREEFLKLDQTEKPVPKEDPLIDEAIKIVGENLVEIKE